MARKTQDRRRQIIGVVAACVSEEGVGGVTMRKVAKRAGASTGMVTHYFSSKTELLRELSLEAERAMRNRIIDRVGTRPGLEWILTLIEESLAPADTTALPWAFWLEYWAAAARDPELAGHYASRLRRLRRDIARSVEACVREGTFRADLDIDLAAESLLTMINGYGLHSTLDHRDFAARKRLDLFTLALDGFRARDQRPS